VAKFGVIFKFSEGRRGTVDGVLAEAPRLLQIEEVGALYTLIFRVVHWAPSPNHSLRRGWCFPLKDAKGTKLVLLGTGAGPGGQGAERATRLMTSHVMLSNGAAYVLDCGLGVTWQYAQTGIPFPALRSIFITHHHADHNIEYGPLLVVGWINGMHLDVR